MGFDFSECLKSRPGHAGGVAFVLSAHLVWVLLEWSSGGQLHPADHRYQDELSPENEGSIRGRGVIMQRFISGSISHQQMLRSPKPL